MNMIWTALKVGLSAGIALAGFGLVIALALIVAITAFTLLMERL